MAINVDENGTITLIQGDSGELNISGFNNKINYDVYLAIKDTEGNPIIKELNAKSNFSDTVIFVLTSDITNMLTVPANKDFEIYNYGIKCCSTSLNSEDTLIIANGDYGTLNQIIVYPKRVEGA